MVAPVQPTDARGSTLRPALRMEVEVPDGTI